MSTRVLVIRTCSECPHSLNTSACWNRAVPGRFVHGQQGRVARPDERGARALPSVSGYAHPEHAPPPDWCPLPKAVAS